MTQASAAYRASPEMRKGVVGLAMLVQQTLTEDPVQARLRLSRTALRADQTDLA
jgi:hypothetical protein